MKKFLCLKTVLLFTLFVAAQNTPEQLSQHIAQKMKDSLFLTDVQKQSVYEVNMQLYGQKLAVRQQYNHSDSLGLKLQRIENRRDTLYFPLLSPQQYQLYKEKKRALISNN